ncbi:MAG: sigma-54-dependent Fis family transcriptional regulator [Deltaproteobacteria bacterium]|nr:MAG: sigma-54-dependent Fis family transcriptional regulator [Deltaproteobacteria bacterium]
MADTLIIDDDEGMRYTLSVLVTQLGHNVSCACSLQEGIQTASSKDFDVVFLDVNLPDGNGLSALPRLKSFPSQPEIIIITGYGNPDGAALAMQTGAWDYIEKGARLKEISLPFTRALEYREEKRKYIRPPVLNREGIIGSSARLQESLDLLTQASGSDAAVLITGETGTGKELFARAIHRNSRRSGKDLVVVDCAALPENLVESVLFGHEKGSFTGADRSEEGLIKQADGGTLFLDEVGELPLKIQKAFLRVLQEHSFRPIGARKEIHSNFRVVSATNQDLDFMVSRGRFRQDLLFRLQSMIIRLPALRERPQDIGELARYYADKLCVRYGLKTKDFSPEFLEALNKYPWPGNVRELINALERSISMAHELSTLFPIHLPPHIRADLARISIQRRDTGQSTEAGGFEKRRVPLPNLQTLLETTERQYIQDLVSFAGWDIKKACSVSGLSRSRFYERLKKHQIQRPA